MALREPLWSNEEIGEAFSKLGSMHVVVGLVRDEYEKRIAQLEAEIKRLQDELDCRDNQLQAVTRVEETETEIIVYGDPGEHNCDQMGCSSIEHVLVIVKKP